MSKLRAEAIDALADYLTGPAVAHNSAGLMVMSSSEVKRAQSFFEMRAKFGLIGYPTKEQAIDAITETISLTLKGHT